MDEKLIKRYHDVKILSEGTSNIGERNNCLNLLARLEAKNPQLKSQYEIWLRHKRREDGEEESEEDVFEWSGLSSMFDRFVSFTEKAFGVRDAISAVSRCQLTKRFNSRSVSITVSIPDDLYESIVVDFNHEQQRVFLDTLANQIKNQIQQDFSQ